MSFPPNGKTSWRLADGLALISTPRWRGRGQVKNRPESRLNTRLRGSSFAALVLVACFAVSRFAIAVPVWVQQGPGPIINGQDEGITSVQGNNPVSGSISAVATSATDPDTIYVAAT